MGEIQKLKGKLAAAVARGKENEQSHAAMISIGRPCGFPLRKISRRRREVQI